VLSGGREKGSGTNGTVMCNLLVGRGLGAVCVLDDHGGMAGERIFHAWVTWARRGYENSCRGELKVSYN